MAGVQLLRWSLGNPHFVPDSSPISWPAGLSVSAACRWASRQEKPIPAASLSRALERAASPFPCRSVRVELWRFPGNSGVPYIPSSLWLALQGSWEATLFPFFFLLTSALLCVPSQAVQEMIHQVLEKLEASPFQMPDYACKTSGAIQL